jgi:2-oxoglutarate dehydrogenase E1 component
MTTTRGLFYGPNAGYAVELYEQYLRDPGSVDPATRAYFERYGPPDGAGTALASTAVLATQQRAQPAVATAGDGRSGATQPTPYFTQPPAGAASSARHPVPPSLQPVAARPDVGTVVRAARLARSIREYGHLAAHVDPLGTPPPGDPMLDLATHGLTDADLAALPASIVWPNAGPEYGSCLDALAHLRAIYCDDLGYEFDHVTDFAERAWLHEAVESGVYREPLPAEERLALLRRLSEVEGFERFLHSTFVGQKRFSIEGLDMLVPLLDELIHAATEAGAREVLLGMAHRGRLNVLAHVLGKPYATIFSEFHAAPNKELVPSEGSIGINFGWTGDVKYHLGARRTLREPVETVGDHEDHTGDLLVPIQLTLAHNPSHLEFVNPVVEGNARAAQDRRDQPGAPEQHADLALAVLIHGDAAFPGEGVVAETLNLSRLPGYSTGGTVHLIANNQVGFTTGPEQGRSTLYAADLAKGYEIPIVHVNADAPEACLSAVRLAHAYRQRFHKDFLIDLVGYRRWGHNEGDEPSFTQPLLYAKIAGHPTVRALYAERLEQEGLMTSERARAMLGEVETRLRAAYDETRAGHVPQEQAELRESPPLASYATAVPAETLRELNAALLARPAGFTPNAKLDRLLQRRREQLEAEGGIDWAHAEALAFAAILRDATPIRLTGQDSERGTFSQRHLVLHDAATGTRCTPLQALPQARAAFAVYNSPLSEAAVIGFEYGYSVHAPDALVLWEAQFGDFANAGQVLIDQFLVAARAKWRQHPSLVLLLPHGYEGQGPEHSSGRVERFLQLAAEDNVRVANPTSAAQYFHLLRAQAASLASAPRPLVVMTPKRLLRHPQAAASLCDLAEGHFQAVLDDAAVAGRRERVTRLLLCNGKVAVELETARGERQERGESLDWIALARLEQFYPFPAEALAHLISGYPNLREIVWVQEEPRNMGVWYYIAPRLEGLLPPGMPLVYAGRPERASPAEGDAHLHAAEQARLIAAALTPEIAEMVEHGRWSVARSEARIEGSDGSERRGTADVY